MPPGVPTAVPSSLQDSLWQEGQGGRAESLGKIGLKLIRKCLFFSHSCPIMEVKKLRCPFGGNVHAVICVPGTGADIIVLEK